MSVSHNFQNFAREELEKKGIFPGPGEDPNSVLRYKMQEGKHPFQLFAGKELEKLGVDILPGVDPQSLYQQVLMKEGDHNFQLFANQELERRVASLFHQE